MDEQPEMTGDECEVFGTLTAFQFMLENLYALAIVSSGGSFEDAKTTRDEFMRQFEDLPSRNADDLIPSEAFHMVQQYAVSRLESMWDAILARVAQSE